MIDWGRIAELKEEVGAEDFDEVVQLFMGEVEGALNALDSDTSTGLEAQMHFLKGSALNLGFSAFAHICQQGETDALQGNSSAIDIAAVRSLFAQSKNVFLHSPTRGVE